MKKTLLFYFLIITNVVGFSQSTSLTVFDRILFYDGYAALVNQPVPTGIIRHRNDLYAKKLTSSQLASFGDAMTLNVTINADCDNYDRIGNVNIALVPKNATTYNPNTVQRIELGRFITPFMNKNIPPNLVPYTFNIDNMTLIFKDPALNAIYDFWMELEVFGVPYAAQTQIEGCAGINSVFYGTVEIVSNIYPPVTSGNVLLPLNFKNNLNNYQAGASDAIGQTVRTIAFNLPNDVVGASFYLINSNHGSNTNGEEYNRRYHYVYFDDMTNPILTYRPGEATCEPYRVFNTQGNGIYSASPRTNAQWQSFSNWCPGAKIPLRKINLGAVSGGSHTFRLSVPTAVFVGGEGYFPVSLYLQAINTALGLDPISKVEYSIYPNPTTDRITLETSDAIKKITISNGLGQVVYEGNSKQISMSNFSNGLYLMKVAFENGCNVTEKIIKK